MLCAAQPYGVSLSENCVWNIPRRTIPSSLAWSQLNEREQLSNEKWRKKKRKNDQTKEKFGKNAEKKKIQRKCERKRAHDGPSPPMRWSIPKTQPEPYVMFSLSMRCGVYEIHVRVLCANRIQAARSNWICTQNELIRRRSKMPTQLTRDAKPKINWTKSTTRWAHPKIDRNVIARQSHKYDAVDAVSP